MVADQHAWKFPGTPFLVMRIEMLFLLILSIFVFIFSFFQTQKSWFSGIIFTLVFLGLYFLISFVIQKVRKVEHHYKLTPTHLHVTKKVKGKTTHEEMPLKEVKKHKVDKVFLGGYVQSHKGKKHVLFFNKKKEAEKFDDLMKKHLAPLKKAPMQKKKK